MVEYIDKQAAIKAVNYLANVYVCNLPPMKYAEDVQNAINGVLSADVQPVRRGHWEKIGNPTWWGLYECSECHQISSIDYCWCPTRYG